MSTTEKLIKARMGMLALAEQLNNISAACRRAGISRSHYYEIKEAFEKFGAEGLAPQDMLAWASGGPESGPGGSASGRLLSPGRAEIFARGPMRRPLLTGGRGRCARSGTLPHLGLGEGQG
jgi:hypothetical protein